MKRKFLITLLAVIAVACAIGLAACDNAGGGMRYGLSNDGSYAICYGYHGVQGATVDEDIVIESEYKGKPVTEVYTAAFSKTNIKSVVMPDTVTYIGGSAFEDCQLLESVKLSKNLKKIEYSAFSHCSALKTIELPEGLETIRGSFASCGLESVTIPSTVKELNEFPEAVDYSAFGLCKNLKSVTFADGLTKIPQNMFLTCTALMEVNIPDSVTTIGKRAFDGCRSLASIVLPESITEIEENAFIACNALTEIYNLSPLEITVGTWTNGGIGRYAKAVNSSTETPSKICTLGDFVFYREDNMNSYLLSYFGSETDVALPAPDIHSENIAYYFINENAFYHNEDIVSVTIPVNARSIGASAFRDCTNLEEITIGETVGEIGESAFANCTKLKKITFADDPYIHTIRERSFNGCTALTEIDLKRDISKWNSIYKGEDWSLGCNFTVHCTDGDIQISGT